MKKTLLVLLFTLLVSSVLFAQDSEIQNGDLIFQTSLSEQSKAIQLAKKSEYSH
jgi:hypothetical protein